MWIDVTKNIISKMDTPVLSCWWHVGEDVTHLFENGDNWKSMAQAIVNTYKRDK